MVTPNHMVWTLCTVGSGTASITSKNDIMFVQWRRRTPVKVIFVTAVSVCLIYSHFLSHNTNVAISHNASEKQVYHFTPETPRLLRIDQVCERIHAGHYAVPRAGNISITSPWLIVDHYHKVAQCVNAKAGSTSWWMMTKLMVEREKQERSEWFKQHSYRWYSKNGTIQQFQRFHKFGYNMLSYSPDTHREVRDGLPDPRTEYFKFIQARHPLERLASGYISRVKGFGDVVKGEIYMMTVNKVKFTGQNLTFEDYLSFVARPDTEMMRGFDRHWRTIYHECDPCNIKYDYVTHLETMDSDLDRLQDAYNVTYLKSKFPVSNKNKNKNGQQQYKSFYRDIPMSILQPVLDKYQVDADLFGYSFDEYLMDKPAAYS